MSNSKSSSNGNSNGPIERREGNLPNIYTIPEGYYLNIEFAGETYREAFTESRYGTRDRARSSAAALRDLLKELRPEIERAVQQIKLHAEGEAGYLRELTSAVTRRVRGMSPAERKAAKRAVSQPPKMRVRTDAAVRPIEEPRL